MTDDRDDHVARIQDLIDREPAAGSDPAAGGQEELGRLCRAAARVLPASGVGVSVMTDTGVQGMVAASDETSALIEELQFTFGEGPCLDAFASRRPVLAAELDLVATRRWPAYTPAARSHGVQAVFAFPIQLGAARLGVLDVYRDRPGALSSPALAEAVAFADTAVAMLLDQQEGSPAGAMATAVEDVFDNRAELFQAQGMVMVQLGVRVEEAMVRLRAFAFAQDRPLSEVARAVVARTLLLEHDPPSSGADSAADPTDTGT